jgi:hypothetical protein
LRNGLNSLSEEEKYINYYSLLEEIARKECEEFIVIKCSNQDCLQELNTGRKATNNFIMSIFDNHKLDKDLKKKAPKLRNKIAHGGAEKNKTYLKDIREVGSHLEEICLLELEKRLPLSIINRLNAHIIDVPIVRHRCVCAADRSFSLIKTTQTIPARFVKLEHKERTAFDKQTAMIGIQLDGNNTPIIDPFSWPDIK